MGVDDLPAIHERLLDLQYVEHSDAVPRPNAALCGPERVGGTLDLSPSSLFKGLPWM